MNSAKLAIKRPIFITCIVLVILIVGLISYRNIGLDLLPTIDFPTVVVRTSYPGAAPSDVTTLISKPLEDELAAIAGVKHISTENTEGFSTIAIEFNMNIDVEQAAQDVRDKLSIVKNKLPTDLEDDPIAMKYDSDSQPILILTLMSNLNRAEAYDLANERIKAIISRVKDVGTVDIIGGRKREIQIEIDQRKMNEYRMSMINLVSKMQSSGSNVSIGKQEHGPTQTVFRSMGDYTSVDQIGHTLLSFSGDVGNSVSINTIGKPIDGLQDETTRAYVYYPDQVEKAQAAGSQRGVQNGIVLRVIKQSGTNTVKVSDAVKAEVEKINKQLEHEPGDSKMIVAYDGADWIRMNVEETVTSIILGIILAIVVVFFFLGNLRSTIITAIAIPNSLLGAIIVMGVMDYTFNLMTLMALSLVVGLLVDDAIVVRENIFRKLEEGVEPHKAAEKGTTEVMLAVIATTLAIISVFFPIGMLPGIIGKLFKQFGFTVIFAMLVSLFDALTVAPFLSAYFAGDGRKSTLKPIVLFEKFQDFLERVYERIMHICLNHPLRIILTAVIVCVLSVMAGKGVNNTFFPDGDQGRFAINIETLPGTSLDGTQVVLEQIEDEVRKQPWLDFYVSMVGGLQNGDPSVGAITVSMRDDRKITTMKAKEDMREMLKKFSDYNPSVDDPGRGKTSAQFLLVVAGNELPSVEESAHKVLEKLKDFPNIIDVSTTMKEGKPEFRVEFDDAQMKNLGVSSTTAGMELRYNVTGSVVGLFKAPETNYSYDIRARLKPDQRDVQKLFSAMKVPNSQGNMVNLSSISKGDYTKGYAQINRMDKAYVVKIMANISRTGGLGTEMGKVSASLAGMEFPQGVNWNFSGQSETMGETSASIGFALIMAILFIYLVLSSLYESFVTPFTILLAIPPALTGALFALFITRLSLDVFSMVGMVMLIGLVTKNSILLVDNAVHHINSGLDRKEAILQAGMRRLRPILMTTFAMLAGMLPLALGIGKAAQMRQSMGVSIMGGIILSTLISLLLVPAVFSYIDRFRTATEAKIIVRRHEIEEKKEIEEDKLDKGRAKRKK